MYRHPQSRCTETMDGNRAPITAVIRGWYRFTSGTKQATCDPVTLDVPLNQEEVNLNSTSSRDAPVDPCHFRQYIVGLGSPLLQLSHTFPRDAHNFRKS